jgi:hypothetical protein
MEIRSDNMRMKYSPRRADGQLTYEFDGEVITATLNEQTDTFDFSTLPDGEAQVELIETVLPENPIRSAKRVDGELYVELLRYVPARPQPSDYETAAEYEAALEAWKRLWTDVEEVV